MQLADCLGPLTFFELNVNKETGLYQARMRALIIWSRYYEDYAAVDSKNILNRKRARVQRTRNDVVDDDLVQDAEREALTVVKELLENELLAFQAQETIKKGAGDLAMAQEQIIR